MDIANLIIRVTNEGLDRATRELRRLQDQAAGAQSANERFGKSIADLNKLAMVGFGALTAVVGGSIKTAISFEKAMAGVAKTVDFATDNGLANMKKGIEDLTKTIPLAFEELAEIASVGGSLGVVEDDILGFTETIAKMGVAFDISAGDAADSMAKIAGVFKIPIAEIGTLGDSINAVSNSVAATAGDVIEVMKRVGGTSGALKISADNTAALSGAMVALGLTPEVAGTAFNTLGTTLANFNDLTKTQASGFKRLGLDTKEFAALIQTDGVGAIKQVLEAAKELGGTDALSALNEAFGAQGIKILQMAEGLDVVDLALEQVAIDANGVSAAFGSMDAEFASVSGTTANKLQLVQNNMRLLAAGVGEAFLPAVNELILALVPVIEKMTAWAQANPELIVQIAKVTAAVLGSIIAIAAISGAVGAALSAFQGLSAIFGVAKIAILALSGPIGLTVIALGILVAAGALVYQNWDLIKQKATEIWGAITSYIGNKISEITNYFSTNFPAMTAIVSGSIEVIKTLFVGGFNLIKNTVTTVLGVIKAVISGDFKAIPGIIGNGLKAAANIVQTMMTNIVNIIKNVGTRLYQAGKDIINGLINGIKSGASGVMNTMRDMASNALSSFKNVLGIRSPSRVMDKMGQHTTDGLAQGIKKGSKNVVSEAEKMAEAVRDIAYGLAKDIYLLENTGAGADFDFDVNNGKYYGAPQFEIDNVKQLQNIKAIKSLEAEVMKDMARYQRDVYEATLIYNNELDRMTFELDHVLGKYKDLKPEMKEFLRNEAAHVDQMRLTAKAAGIVRDFDKQIALVGSNSNFDSIAYDLQNIANELSKLPDLEKAEILSKAWQLEEAEKTHEIAKDIFDSVKDVQREISLIDDNSAIAQLNYDLQHTSKYAYATADDIEMLRTALMDLDLAKAQKSSQTAFDDLLADMRGGTEIDKLNEQYRDKLIIIEQFENAHTDLLGEALEARYQLTDEYNRAMGALMLDSGESIFGGLSSIMKDAVGEQSNAYRAMFAIEKGFAIAQSALAIQQAVAKAMAIGFPANIPLIAQAVSQGASIMSALKSVRAPIGQAHDGIMSVPKSGTWNLEKGERVLPAHTAKAMDKKLAEGGGGDVNITVNNMSSAKVETQKDEKGNIIMTIRDEIKRGFTELRNPNSYNAKMVQASFNTTVKR